MSGKHPTVKPNDFTIVEDTRTNKIVSSRNLISQTWAYRGIPFKFGRPNWWALRRNIVGEALVRKQFEVIHALERSKG